MLRPHKCQKPSVLFFFPGMLLRSAVPDLYDVFEPCEVVFPEREALRIENEKFRRGGRLVFKRGFNHVG